MFLFSLLSAAAIDVFSPIAKWTTLGILLVLVAIGVVLFFAKRTIFSKYVKYAFFATFVYLLILAIAFFVLDIAHHYSDAYAEENWLDKDVLIRFVFIPLLVFSSLTLVTLIAYTLVSKFLEKHKRTYGFIGFSICLGALIAALVCIAIYYSKKIANDGYYNSDTATVKQIALYSATLIAVATIIALTFFDKSSLAFNVRSLAYAGILTAMSFALSYIKLWDMPYGGSVTLVSTLPLMLYSYLFGTKKGVFVGFIYGALQAVQDPWIIHPAQFLLDYPIAFSAIGLAGILGGNNHVKKLPQLHFAIGALIAGTMRFICHTLSGVFAFEAYASGKNVWAYSLAYNSYVFIDIALVIIAGVLVLSSKSFIATVSHLSKNDTSQTKENTNVNQ